MIPRLIRWYPFLFAPLPVLNTLTRNPGATPLEDAGEVLVVTIVGCAAIYLAVALVFRGRRSSAVVPLIVVAAILLFYSKAAVRTLARQYVGVSPLVVLVVFLALVTLAVWLLSRRPAILDRVNTFFALSGTLVAVWLGVRLTAGLIRSQSIVRNSKLAQELQRPIRTRVAFSGARAKPDRDIYLLVLDEYANSAVLQEVFQFDNRAFEDSLRQLGFSIPKLVRSNYAHTLLSLPSLLNFRHLTELTSEVGARSNDATLPNRLLENNRTVEFLQSRGYQFLFFPSQWWPATRESPQADWIFEPWHGFDLEREASRSHLQRTLISTTALDVLQLDNSWDADHLRRTLTALKQVPQRQARTFTFAHLLSPHSPYVLEADCRVAEPILGQETKRQAYIGQLQCLNRLLLETVTTILRRSSPAPIILLQGDHGTNMLRYSAEESADSISPSQARERLGAFGAYYLPDGGGRLFADTVTVVNVFQKVLSHYFGADIAPAPDDLYMSLEGTPYLFAKVDPAALRP